MEQRQHSETEALLERLAASHEPGEFADFLYEEVERLLGTGYPRRMLLEDMKHLTLFLRSKGQEEKEDDVLEVLDALYGQCAPSARL